MIIAIPYYTKYCDDLTRNISAYAVSRDYHAYFRALFDELIPQLERQFPMHRFAGFADHSPIDEIVAASRAGLGVIGKNHLLLTEKYSSYVFLGELITDACIPCSVGEIRVCQGCGACEKLCPAIESGTCLSALTQKKGVLTSNEISAMLKYKSAWGCDICQEVCPHTKKALRSGTIYSPIPYFSQQAIPHLSLTDLDTMSDTAFSDRAYSWRGRETIRRNLELFEKNEKGEHKC